MTNETNAPISTDDTQPESFDRHTQPIEPSIPSELRPQAPEKVEG